MRKFLLISIAGAALSIAAPMASMAQTVYLDTPVGGVRIGEPEHYYHPYWGYTAPRYYDRDDRRVYRDRDGRGWRDRDVGMRRRDRDRD